MDIHNSIMDIHNHIMDIHNSCWFMDIHKIELLWISINRIVDIHNRIIDIHNSPIYGYP